ncbi:MAG: sugar ABC transporter substrate-binding protein [Chloroflexi bacterium]|nr:sugar ABC transporter substrate-binding protein [Chloroflexota bacterium]
MAACAAPAATQPASDAPAATAAPADTSVPSAQGEVEATSADAGEITILYIDNPTWWSEQAQRFTEATGIKVNWEGVPFDKLHDKMFTAFASGDSPWDIIHVRDDWVSEFGSRGFLMPLDDLVTPEMKSQSPERAWKNLSVDGQQYGVPRYFWLWQFYYNQDILSAGGYTQAPTTWDEVAQMAEALTTDTNGDGKVDRWGYCEPWGENFASNPFIIHLRAAGGDVFDDAGNPIFNSEAGVKALTWMVDMAKTDNYCPSAFEMATTGALTELFLQGSIAMIPDTPQVYGMAKDPTQSKLTGGEVAAALVPGDVSKSGTYAETGGLAIPANAKNPEGAMKFIQFVTSFEEEKRMAMEPGNIPAMTAALEDTEVQAAHPNYAFVEEQMQYPFGTISNPRAQEVNGAIARNVIDALHGNLTPKEALDKAYQEVVDIMNQ